MAVATLLVLPVELLGTVCNFLDGPSLLTFRFVCRSANAAVGAVRRVQRVTNLRGCHRIAKMLPGWRIHFDWDCNRTACRLFEQAARCLYSVDIGCARRDVWRQFGICDTCMHALRHIPVIHTSARLLVNQSWRLHTLTITNIADLDLSAYGDLRGVHTATLGLCRKVRGLGAVGHCRKVGLYNCELGDVHALGSVHALDIIDCWQFADTSALGGVHTLRIRNCPDVTDVSALGRVHTLDLSLSGVTDVRTLGGVHTLNLTATRVEDVSALGGVHELNLTSTRVTDVRALGNVHTLILSGTRIADVSSLRGVKRLHLNGTLVKNVKALGNAQWLDLSGTPVRNVSMLGKVTWLNLTDTRVVDVSALGGVRTLNLSRSLPLRGLHHLKTVHTLYLLQCEWLQPSDIAMLAGPGCQIKELSLHGSWQLDLSIVESIPFVDDRDYDFEYRYGMMPGEVRHIIERNGGRGNSHRMHNGGDDSDDSSDGDSGDGDGATAMSREVQSAVIRQDLMSALDDL